MQKIARIGSDRFKKVSAEGHCSRLFRVTQPTAYTAYTSAFLCIDEAFKCLFEITYRGCLHHGGSEGSWSLALHVRSGSEKGPLRLRNKSKSKTTTM